MCKRNSGKQDNRRLHFVPRCALPSPFLSIGDAAYHQRAGGGPSHGRRQHVQKFGKNRACGSGDILADRQTDRQMHSSQYFETAPAGEVIIKLVKVRESSKSITHSEVSSDDRSILLSV